MGAKKAALGTSIITCLLALVAFCVLGCGGRQLQSANSTPDSLAQAIAQVESAETPEGVDPTVYAELKAELIRVISELTDKGTSIPPTGAQNQVTDLLLLGNNTDGYRLEWSYLNTGDYDLNSEVNISDLTPIGMHLGTTQDDTNWLEACCADGDGNGEVNIADVTPIGQNYQVSVAGFNVYGSDSAAGPWTLDSFAPLGDVPAEPPHTVGYDLPAHDYGYYQVTPVDGAQAEGVQSDFSFVCGDPAVVTLGDDQDYDTQTVGATGGTLTGPDEGGRHIEVTIPEGALDEDVEFTVGENDGTVALNGEALEGRLIYLSCEEPQDFNAPVLIKVPVTPGEDRVVVPSRLQSDGGLDPVALDTHDEINGYATISLLYSGISSENHSTSADAASGQPTTTCLLVEGLMEHGGPGGSPEGYAYSSKFSPKLDGFTHSDKNSHCTVGACAFAMWFYYKYRESHYHLSECFPDEEIQRIILSRAGNAYLNARALNYTAICSANVIPKCFQQVKEAILKSSGPVMIWVIQGSKVTGPMLAYGYEGSKLLLYNPLAPSRIYQIDTAATDFKFAVVGLGSIYYHESFENILSDATDEPPFGGSEGAAITIESPSAGEVVGTDNVTLTGSISSGLVLIEELIVWNSRLDLTTIKKIAIPQNGAFTYPLSLAPGNNRIVFITRGRLSVHDLPMCDVPNNLQTGSFNLTWGVTPATLEVTSHTDGQDVHLQSITLKGNCTEGGLPLDTVSVLVNYGKEYSVELADSGSFLTDILVKSGTNKLLFKLYARVNEQLTEVPHNMKDVEFILNGDFSPAVVRVTLYRDEGQFDYIRLPPKLGMFVYSPVPDVVWCYYRHPQDPDGGSFGYVNKWYPDKCERTRMEWFVLDGDDIVRYGEEYEVRVHLWDPYASGGAWTYGPTNYEVEVLLNEDTSSETSARYSGSIPYEDVCPHDPPCGIDGTGCCWRDVCTFTPVEQTGS